MVTPDLPELGWRTYAISFSPTPRLRRLALVGALAVAAAVISGRGELAAVAAAPHSPDASGSVWRCPPPVASRTTS
jgi:hypothetical protein